MAHSPSPQLAVRIRAFDWLRGLAVLFMIQCHALTLLDTGLRQGPLFRRLVWLDGLVAPSFIFSAGFSLALVQVRAALAARHESGEQAQQGRRKRFLKTLRRIGEVLAVATFVNWVWFPILSEPHWLWRLDILHCIGLSLLLALPLMSGLASRPTFLAWLSLGLAAIVFAVSPYAEQVRGPWAIVANGTRDALFPLLPWAGYVYLGASAGAMAGLGNRKRLYGWLGMLLAVGALLAWQAKRIEALYPPHNFWVTDPANHGQRWALVMGILFVLLFAEQVSRPEARWLRSLPVRFVETLGGASMAAYVLHLMLLHYRFFGYSVNGVWGGRSSWPLYWLLTAGVILLTWALSRVTDRLYEVWNRRLAGPLVTPASKDRVASTAPTPESR